MEGGRESARGGRGCKMGGLGLLKVWGSPEASICLYSGIRQMTLREGIDQQ